MVSGEEAMRSLAEITQLVCAAKGLNAGQTEAIVLVVGQQMVEMQTIGDLGWEHMGIRQERCPR